VKRKNKPFSLLCTLKYNDVLHDTTIIDGADLHEADSEVATEGSEDMHQEFDKVSHKGVIRGFQPNFVYKDKLQGLCVVYDDCVTIWDESDYSLISEFKFDKVKDYQIKQVVFDGKGKRIALHTSEGLKIIDVEIKKQLWKLDFKSIKLITSSGYRNSQFFITMNSEDTKNGTNDTLIIFNFGNIKPLKIVKFSGLDQIMYGKYVTLNNLDSPSICLITAKGYVQYINCMKRGESTFQTRMDLIKKENSYTSPAITPMVNFGDLDEEIEEFKLEQSKE